MKKFEETNEIIVEMINKDLHEHKYIRAALECFAAIIAWTIMGLALIASKITKFVAGICILIPGIIWKMTHKQHKNKEQLAK